MRFSATEKPATSPILRAVLGDEADAGVEDGAHALADEFLPVEHDAAFDAGGEADDGLHQFSLAVALHTGDREDLAGRTARSTPSTTIAPWR